MLVSTINLIPEYGIPLGKVITGARKAFTPGYCPDSNLTWQMKDWVMNCSDEKAYTEGCEKNQYHRYEFDVNVNRANTLWKYKMFTGSQRVDLGPCAVQERRSFGYVYICI